MVEIVVLIIVIVCMMYILKGDLYRKKVVVTIVESLPLGIFKKPNNIEHKEIIIKHNIEVSDEAKVNSEKELNVHTTLESNNKLEDNERIGQVHKKEINSIETLNDENNKGGEKEEIKSDKELEVACDSISQDEDSDDRVEEIVYWTPNGKTYHGKNTCRTLSRSKVINSGSICESGKDFKCEHCK